MHITSIVLALAASVSATSADSAMTADTAMTAGTVMTANPGPSPSTPSASPDLNNEMLSSLRNRIIAAESGFVTLASRATALPPYATQMQELHTGPHHPVPISLLPEQLESRLSQLYANPTSSANCWPHVCARTADAAPSPSTPIVFPALDNELLPALAAALLATVTDVAALPTPTGGFATRIRREPTAGPAQNNHTDSSDGEFASLLHMLASAIRNPEDGASTTSAARTTASDPPYATQMQELSTGPHHPVPTSETLEQLESRISDLLATATFPTATFPPIRSFTRPTVVMERGEPEAKAETVTDDGIV